MSMDQDTGDSGGNSGADSGGDDAGAGAGAPVLPLFYGRPLPVDRQRHAGVKVQARSGYGFARASNSVPLNGVEFALAVKFYPIVFSAADPAVPIAVLGLRDGENLMIDEAGRWRDGCYVPAYVRRYPFIFMEDRERRRLTLCIDEGSDFLGEEDGQALFDQGKETDFIRTALEFCTAYQKQYEATVQFGQAMSESGLLEERNANVKLGSGEALSLGGFRTVNETRLNELDDDTFLRWRRQGWLHLIYAHLMSISNWAALANRVGA